MSAGDWIGLDSNDEFPSLACSLAALTESETAWYERSSMPRKLADWDVSTTAAAPRTTTPATLLRIPVLRAAVGRKSWATKRAAKSRTARCGRSSAVPAAPTSSSGIAAAAVREQVGRPERRDADEEHQPRLLADARRPVEKRGKQKDEGGIPLVVAVGKGDAERRKRKYWPQKAKDAKTTKAARGDGPMTV